MIFRRGEVIFLHKTIYFIDQFFKNRFYSHERIRSIIYETCMKMKNLKEPDTDTSPDSHNKPRRRMMSVLLFTAVGMLSGMTVYEGVKKSSPSSFMQIPPG